MTTTDPRSGRDHDSALPAEGWRTSSFCGPNGGNCVEVNRGVDAIVGVADTKPVRRTPLSFPAERFAGFVAEARAGRFDG